MNELDLESLRQKCSAHLEMIGSNFTPDCKLTLVVRKPGNDEADFVLSNDKKPEIVKAVNRRL